ncbi:hypothetical protein PENTCL1PPCAC_8458 [Pristionchus entomophagus]|uniref:C2H2-type domain-containing protein n=1 Tax=Pristionchus entomophagus TaxID=358040 RepID=A0AAV5ST81_9BILA|nr:hypothetical protein PENTCL1PPCAC_8458 [Pristionchus entomophagus]
MTKKRRNRSNVTNVESNSPSWETLEYTKKFIYVSYNSKIYRIGTLRKTVILSDDEDSKKPFKCEECGMQFSRSSNLQVHTATHLSDDNPNKNKFKCEICGKAFITSSNLKIHMQKHAGTYFTNINLIIYCIQ